MDDTSGRVEELRVDIEETRGEMSETIGAIQEKLRPAHIVAEATDRMKQATMEGVRDMSESVVDTTREAISGRAVPLALIGLGAAWLFMDRNAHTSSASSRAPYWTDGEGRRHLYEYEREAEAKWHNTSAGHQYSTSKENVGAGLNQIGKTASSMKDRVQRMVRGNPLLIGAGVVILGAALGLSVPETDVENEWMGEARDSVLDRAQHMAQDTAAKVQESAASLADTAGRIATGGTA